MACLSVRYPAGKKAAVCPRCSLLFDNLTLTARRCP